MHCFCQPFHSDIDMDVVSIFNIYFRIESMHVSGMHSYEQYSTCEYIWEFEAQVRSIHLIHFAVLLTFQ